MRRDKGLTARETGYYEGMVKISRFIRKLDNVSLKGAGRIPLNALGTNSSVHLHKIGSPREKIIEKFNAAPCRRAVVWGYVIPAEIGSEIHLTASGVYRLRDEIRAVAAPARKIDKKGIARERPSACVFDRARTVVLLIDYHLVLRSAAVCGIYLSVTVYAC